MKKSDNGLSNVVGYVLGVDTMSDNLYAPEKGDLITIKDGNITVGACIGVNSRDCITKQGCAGREGCNASRWSGVCEILGYYCDNNCDGKSETCRNTPCASCGCISGSKESCYNGSIFTQNIGICKNGTKTCSSTGKWGKCIGQILPQTEACNADQKDENCNGVVNENCDCNDAETSICGTTDVGECNYGTKTCVGGHWNSCVGNIEPTNEICDNKDNDCDGMVDEGCEASSTTTSSTSSASTHQKYYGYYSWDNKEPEFMTSFTNFKNYGYLTTYNSTKLESLINSSENSGLKSMLNLKSYFAANLLTQPESEWRSYLTDLKNKLGSNSNKVQALFLFDEPDANFRGNFEKVNRAINLTKEIFPDINTFLIFSNPLANSSIILNNQNLDWIGIDPYFVNWKYESDMIKAGLDPYACGSEQKKRFNQAVQKDIYWVKSKGKLIQDACVRWKGVLYGNLPNNWTLYCTSQELSNISAVLNSDTDKKIVLVAQSFKCNKYHANVNISSWPSPCQQQWYYDYAKSDPDIMGFMWYKYASSADVQNYEQDTANQIVSCIGVGMQNPEIIEKHKSIGMEILCNNQENKPFCANNSASYKNADQAKCQGLITTKPDGAGNGKCDSDCGADTGCHGKAPGTNNCTASCKTSIISSDLSSIGNDRVKLLVENNTAKMIISQLIDNQSVIYPYSLFNYTIFEDGRDVESGFTNASLAITSEGPKLRLSDSTRNIIFYISLQNKSDYILFNISEIFNPDNKTIKQFELSLIPSRLICPKSNPSCRKDDFSFIKPYCLSPNCDNSIFYPKVSTILRIRSFEFPNFPIEHSKYILITADNVRNSLEFAHTSDLVKKQLNVDRDRNYDPTFFATGGFVYNKANTKILAQKLNSFGYKRILIVDGAWRKSKGLWDLKQSAFPDGLKSTVDIFHNYGIKVGLHLLAATVSNENVLFTTAPLATNNNIAKNSSGSPIHRYGYESLYLINYFDPKVLSNLADNLTSNFNSNGVDFAYLDGTEFFGIENNANDSASQITDRSETIMREFIKEFAEKTKIDFQSSSGSGYSIYMDKGAITDIWNTGNDMMSWIDNDFVSPTPHPISHEFRNLSSARSRMGSRRISSQIPNFGWTPLRLNEDSYHYAYALDAAIANGAPLTTEMNTNLFFENANTSAYQPIFKERLDIYNQISSASVLISDLNDPSGQQVIQFENNTLGVTLPRNDSAGIYNLMAGSNRRIFIDPFNGTNISVNLSFNDLEPNTRYLLLSNNITLNLSFKTDDSGNGFTTLLVDSSKNDYLFISLKKIKDNTTNETCNNKDDDLDGAIDEGCDDDNDDYCDSSMNITGTPSTCTKGGKDCNDNNTNINPGAKEKCNNIDDDCDGAIDETFTNKGTACTVGIGECKRTGTYICNAQGTNTTCNATQGESCFIRAVYKGNAGGSQNSAKDIIYSTKMHNANVVNFFISNSTIGYQKFIKLLNESKNTDIKIWAGIYSPSAAKINGGSYPYFDNYTKWSAEMAKLFITYPNLEALAIDDFSHNYAVFTPEYLQQMRAAADEFNPDFKFVPVIYYPDFGTSKTSAEFASRAEYFDAIQFYYRGQSSGTPYFDPFNSTMFLKELNKLKSLYDKDILIGVYSKRHSTIGFSTKSFVQALTTQAGKYANGIMFYWQDIHTCYETNGTYTTYENRDKYNIARNLFGKYTCNQNTACEAGENYANCPTDCPDSIEQFPSSSTASSEFDTKWKAANIVDYPGKENCTVNAKVDFPSLNFRCGGYLNDQIVSEWKKKTIDENATINLTYPSQTYVSSIEITGNDIFITKIEAKNSVGIWETVWAGSAYDDYCFLKVGFTKKVLTKTIRITTGAGKWSSIAAAKIIGTATCTATTEICNNIDDDCDGAVDESFTNKGTACTVGIGECKRTGTYICNAQGTNTTCNAVSGAPTAEICDNKDDDCDGTIDENLVQSCYTGPNGTKGIGLCKEGTQNCTTGNWGTCNGEIKPTNETCDANNQDEDCDGTSNEGCSCNSGQKRSCGTNNIGICRLGNQTCSNNGTWGACIGAVNPANEICDNLDNDCDGIKDDNLTNTSSNQNGRCLGNNLICTNGTWIANSSNYNPQNETCNGLDDDCDGMVDEELGNATCGFGVCLHEIADCVDGVVQVCDPLEGAFPEVCDGLDNNCDNITDEGCECVEDWSCSDWSSCSENTQARTCIDDNDCGTQNNMPSLTQTCSSGGGGGGGGTPRCIESWSCTTWSVCESDGFRRRSCVDDKKCGTSNNKPKELETCLYNGNCDDGIMNGDELGVDCDGRCSNHCTIEADAPKISVFADPISAEILDTYILKVIIENEGESDVSGLIVTMGRWSDDMESVVTLTPGMKSEHDFKLSLPGDPSVNSVDVQVIHEGSLVATRSVPVVLSVPDLNFKLSQDTKTGKLYQALVFDNRNNPERTLDVEFTVNKGRETYIIDSDRSLIVGENELFHRVDYLYQKLPLGEYEVKSTFYENGEPIRNIVSFVTIENSADNRKIFNAEYIFYFILLIIVVVSVYIFMSSYRRGET